MDVKTYMHTGVTTVSPEALANTAYQMMTLGETRIRHLPVVLDDGTLIGIVTDRDLRRVGASDAPSMSEHELIYLLAKLRVREVMTKEVVTVSGTTSVMHAGQLFLQKKFGCLPVVRENHTLEGIITVTDLLRAYVAQADAEHSVGVRSMVQTQVVTASPTMSLADLQRLMGLNHIRHVPVVSGSHLVGMMTDRDLRDAIPSPATTLTRGEIAYRLETTPIKTCMTQELIWVGPEVTMVQATRVLLQHTIGCLPIVDNGTLVGVVTDMDCVRAFLSTASGA
ncbi:MAG: CBS domain-containing protein [Candidatus Tectomicrobia bacterium]|uniref:CBS domain-containing protein n=1 Tax=Tectimicrobiota bacterium TaxID=2528274 RepID=A0A937VYB1_UNCTE|nr:CBS domain-containing protein [Candidatus Tectomicrobia bacterium]